MTTRQTDSGPNGLAYFDAWTQIGGLIGDHPSLPAALGDLEAGMDRCGIANALVARRDVKALDSLEANVALSDQLSGGLSPVWVVMPGAAGDFPEGEALAQLLDEYHVPAVRVCPRTHGWDAISLSGRCLIAELSARGWPVFVELGTEMEIGELARLAEAVPGARFVAVNLEWTRQRMVSALARDCPNVYLALHLYHANRGIEQLVSLGAADRLLFSTGSPVREAGAARAALDWADITDTTRRMIAGDNLRRILKYPPATKRQTAAAFDSIVLACQAGKPLPCDTIDFHAHVVNDGSNSGGSQVMLRGDAKGMLEMADRTGVREIGLMTWQGIQGVEQEAGHRTVVDAVQTNPDRLWGLASIHVGDKTDSRKIAELDDLRRRTRILGLKPYPTMGLPYDHPKYAALWEYAQAHGLYVGVHPYHWYEPGEFRSLCSRYPELTVVAYHAGSSYEIADTVITLCREFPNLYAEINYSTVTGGVIEYLVKGCGAERVLFGSDQPMRDPRHQLGWVVYADVPEAVKTMILGANARRLLSRLSAT